MNYMGNVPTNRFFRHQRQPSLALATLCRQNMHHRQYNLVGAQLYQFNQHSSYWLWTSQACELRKHAILACCLYTSICEWEILPVYASRLCIGCSHYCLEVHYQYSDISKHSDTLTAASLECLHKKPLTVGSDYLRLPLHSIYSWRISYNISTDVTLSQE